MAWLLRRFGRSRGALICYLRENGPIAYGADILSHDPRARAAALIATDLAWYWRTTASVAGVREWTRLTAWSLAALLADIGDASRAQPSGLVLIGLDSGDAPSEIDDARAGRWLRGFDGGADRPLHAVIARYPPDSDLAFVAQHPIDSVVRLLQTWGIDRDKADRQPYARLRGRSLDSVARSLVDPRRA